MIRPIRFLLLLALVYGSTASAATIVNPSGGNQATSAGAPATTSGQAWFLSNPPSYMPFTPSVSTLNGTGGVAAIFLDDDTVFAAHGLTNAQAQFYISNDGGRTFFTSGLTKSPGGGGPSITTVSAMAKAPNGATVLAVSGNIGANLVFGIVNGTDFTFSTCTGCNGLSAVPDSIIVSGSTLMAVNTNIVCTSTNNSATWACVVPAGGLDVNARPAGNQTLVSPTPNVWIMTYQQNGSGNWILQRSTDNGVTWAQVFNGGTGGANGAIACLSSTICLAVQGSTVIRSTNAGATWTTISTSLLAADGVTSSSLQAVAVFDATTAVLLPFPSVTGALTLYRTTDGGQTFQIIAQTQSCPTNTGIPNKVRAIVTRNGRAFWSSDYTSLSIAGSQCSHYGTTTAGGTTIVSPIGQPLVIDQNGAAQVISGVQRDTILNSSTTGAANAATIVTLAAVTNQRAHLYKVDAFCSAGTASLTIQDGATTIFTLTGAVPASPAHLDERFTPVGLTGSINTAMTITVSTCGVGNASTVNIQADRF